MKVASIRATRKNQRLEGPKGPTGGKGQDGRFRYQIYREVAEDGKKKWSCTCPAFRFRRGYPCKHQLSFWNVSLPAEDVIVTVEALDAGFLDATILTQYGR